MYNWVSILTGFFFTSHSLCSDLFLIFIPIKIRPFNLLIKIKILHIVMMACRILLQFFFSLLVFFFFLSLSLNFQCPILKKYLLSVTYNYLEIEFCINLICNPFLMYSREYVGTPKQNKKNQILIPSLYISFLDILKLICVCVT